MPRKKTYTRYCRFLRDAAALLLIFQTGVRIGTLSNLTTKHIDMDESLLKIDGGLLKNHQQMYLPFDSKMKSLLVALIAQNDRIRKESQINNDRIFITMYGVRFQLVQQII